ncbi:MAG TPA: DinB family protein [Candidatus Acidoferrum sp.]|jgi:uncharacterized damage-inducible protein DinB
MRRLALSLCAIFLCHTTFTAASLRAQNASADKPAAMGAPTSGARAEFLGEVSYFEQRFTRLAEAIPADKYSWKPGEGVRSIGEVYAHVAAGNYFYAKLLGTPFPAGVDPKAVSGLTDKSKIVQALKDSYAHLRATVANIKDSDLESSVKLPGGRESTVRGAFMFIAGHTGEHLGQSIAYARQNGIVPPWTEDRIKQEAAKPKQ